MADETQVATPPTPDAPPAESPATPTPRSFKIPVESPVADQHLHQGRRFKIPVESQSRSFNLPVERPQNESLTDNPDREGTYGVKIGGQTVQVPFSKVPRVVGINRIMHPNEPFADEETANRFYKDLSAADPKKAQGMVDESNSRLEELRNAPPPAEKKEEQKSYEPFWWTATKGLTKGTAHVLFGSSGGLVPALPGMKETVQGMVQEGAAKGDPNAQMVAALQQAGATPRASISGTQTFQRIFDPRSENRFSRFVTGTVKAGESMTSLENLYALGSIYAMPESIAKPMGLRFQADLAGSGLEGVATAAQATAETGDKGAGAEKWGDLFGNMLTIVAMHYGEHGAKTGIEALKNRETTAVLDDHAQDLYKKDFGSLDDNQKAAVLYDAVEESNPKFKKRVDLEVKRLNERQGVTRGRAAVVEQAKKGIDILEPTPVETQQARLEVAKRLARQIIVNRTRQEAYRHQAAQREAETRRAIQAESDRRTQAMREQGERDRVAEEAQSDEQRRGFAVTEGRLAENTPVTGLRRTTEREPGQRYDPEPAAPAIQFTERRATGGELPERTPQVVAAESRVQELTEGRMGQSFSSLPLSKQRVAARWLERFQPEAWTGFQGTPAHQEFSDRVRDAALVDAALKQYTARTATGTPEGLHPQADLSSGVARLILDRTDMPATLKADPDTYRDLNQFAEQTVGSSFDALPESDRLPTLAEYLRKKPERVKAFLTPDLAERIRSGQHVDLANMEAQLADRQQIQLLMAERDRIQRDMNAALADRMVQQATRERNTDVADEVRATATDLTRLGSDLGLGVVDSVDDLFRIEKTINDTRDDLRTPKMRDFVTRMNRVRVAAEDHALRRLAEQTADSLRSDDPVGAREKAIRSAMEFGTRAADLQEHADTLRSNGQSTAAAIAQAGATSLKAKVDAIETGVQAVDNPAPQPQQRFAGRMLVGSETRVKTDRRDLPAHYVVVEADDTVASHNPFTWEETAGFDQNGQPRKYHSEDQKPARTAAHSRANQLDMEILLATGVTTMDGPSVADQRLHIISGNGRDFSMSIARKDVPEQWAKYRQGLADKAASFGIDPAQLATFKNPKLLKVLDNPITDPHEWAMLGKELNDSPSFGINVSDLGFIQAQMLTDETLNRLGEIINSLPLVDKNGKAITVREAMRARSADIASVLVDSGVIPGNQISAFLDKDGELNERAKDMFESMMAGVTVTDANVLGKASDAVKDKLARAGMFFLKARKAGSQWDLVSMNTDAVRLFTRAQDAKAKLENMVGRERAARQMKESDVSPERVAALRQVVGKDESVLEKFLHPERFLDADGMFSFDGQPMHPPVHAGVEALAFALEQSPRDYASMLARYANASNGVQGTMFGAEHPADVFTNEIGSQYGLKVIPEEWGSVVGLSDSLKEEIESGRGPLPVEPETHAATVVSDVTPDSTSVTDAMPDEPRTVQELHKALETHPGYTDEQRDALVHLFETILPRAMGQDLGDLLGNRRLRFKVGGKDPDHPDARGSHEVLADGSAMIRLCDSASVETFLHEMAHYLRQYLKPADQAVADAFVGAKPGQGWTEKQDEMFAKAFERYHYDGGIRRGALEKVFGVIHRAMQSIYNAAEALGLAKGTRELNQMFDNWYDWSRSERKPITARIDVDALVEGTKGEWPKNLKSVDFSDREVKGDAQRFIFTDTDAAKEFINNKRNGVKAWRMYKEPGKDTIYMLAEAKGKKKLFQGPKEDLVSVARRARDLEAQLKRTTDPREQARLRGVLNGLEDKLRNSTMIIGAGRPEPQDGSVIQLVHGMAEEPRLNEPTTPAQAAHVEQVYGDPTAISLGGERRGKEAEPVRVPSGPPGVQGPGEPGKVPESVGAPDGGNAPRKGRGGTPIATPEDNPLAGVKAAKLKAPEVARGTPVVDPEKWREHVEALGWPAGTPPPTVRLDTDVRSLLSIYPGQPEAVEGVLSAWQQHDATILAIPTGGGKTFCNSAIAAHVVSRNPDAVGLIVTRSRNLIDQADGYVETARRFGVDVNDLPQNMADMSTGVYASTYAQLRGNRDILSIPWDFVIFDESAEARNWTESEQGKSVVLLGHAAKKVVYSSATPYSTVMELGYMHKLGLWPKGGFAEWAGQFGLREVGPNTFSGGTSAKRLTKLRQQLIERGQWQTLYKDMDGVEGHVVLQPLSEEAKKGIRDIRAAFAMARKAFERARMSRYITPAAGHEAIYLKRYIESQRLPHLIEMVKKSVAAGWRPLIFSEYRSGADEGMDFFNYLPGDMGKKINQMLPPLPDVVEELRKAFGNDVAIFAGEANQIRAEELEGFQSDAKKVLYMTYAAGGVGASAHDKVGDKPRMAYFLGLPWSGIMFEQGTGRPWRYGTRSNVANIFMTSDVLPEMKLLATKILPRMRALKAAVYGEKVESSLSKSLRESVGIPEEMLQYEQGEEVEANPNDFEQTAEGVKYTHVDDFEMPDAKNAKNKGMKYKGVGRKLFQDPKNPFDKAAQDAWKELAERTSKLPASQECVIHANEGVIKAEAAKAGRRAMRTSEPVDDAVRRKTRDMENEALIWLDDMKDTGHAASHFVKSTLWMFGTSGDRAVDLICRDAGMAKQGDELKRRMIDYDLRVGNYRGEFGGMVAKIIDDHNLKAADLELVSRVVEGQATTDDPRIKQAVADFRQFTATVRKRLANSGLSVVFYNEKGQRAEVPYKEIADDPNYWPRIYDWHKKIVLTMPDGKKEVTSLGDIMNMPTGSERREALIDRYAETHGISKIKAQMFFEKNARGIRLAGNIERAREHEIPMYGRDRKALERYVNEVSEKLASAEVHGQFREKTDPLIDALPDESTRRLVNHIITADLDPARLHDADRLALRWANRWLVVSKMSLSALKLPFHLAKTSLATNSRSLVRAMVKGVTSPREMRDNAVDCGAMTNYIKQAWMREYGMKTGGIDQRMLDFNGFTAILNFSRVIAAGAGRLWFEKYAYPELRKDPKNPILRRKLRDLYGMSDEQLDSISTNGYGPQDVKRMELGAANWTTGSGRPSELPPALRGTTGDPLYDRLTTLLRISQSLHGFMFKTANLVNRTVWHELLHADWKTKDPYQLVGRFAVNFGLAGWALQELLHLRHQMSGSSEAEIEKRRKEWLDAHPMSKEAVFNALSDISMGMAIEPLSQFFDQLATHDPKDKEKMVQQNRVLNSATDLLVGVAARDTYNAAKSFWDYAATFEDTGPHRQTPQERRENIEKRLVNEEIPISRLAVKPEKVEPTRYPHRRRRAASALR